MNKELFVSSTPHETKVGLVEDDLLAEIYLERENEYTLAGSIYKGRVTRVLPGMQSAFVDIGLERDAFLYVSDFMELEEHDEDVTDVVPAGRGVQDLRSPIPSSDKAASDLGASEGAERFESGNGQDSEAGEEHMPSQTSPASEVGSGISGEKDSPERERGWRGRRRRRGGRRDGRGEGRDRVAEPRVAAPVVEDVPSVPVPVSRPVEPRRPQQFGPPAGYQPMILPGESISKYRGMAQPLAVPERPAREQRWIEQASKPQAESATPLAVSFPEDEPVFSTSSTVAPDSVQEERPHEEAQHEDEEAWHAQSHLEYVETIEPQPLQEEPVESAGTTVDWNREFRQRDSAAASAPAVAPEPAGYVTKERQERRLEEVSEISDQDVTAATEQVVAFASAGTFEEETIDEEEADAVRYEQSSDEGYDEFEEETQAAGQHGSGLGNSETLPRVLSEVRETVDEIHMSSLAESGVAPLEGTTAEGEEDPEEAELEEAQAKAEALLDAEAGGTGVVDARAEVRAPSGTAGYTQRAPRPRPGYDRRSGGRRPGGRRFPRREAQEVPKISDLLKEGQEILVQIAKEPIGKKGARITSHIALPGRFLVYMPTVNHTGVSRKIASDEERQRLKRIVMSERENGHGGFIVRTAAQSASEEELRADIRFLKGLWNDIKTRAEASKPPALIYHDLNVVERVLRDQVTSDFSVIWVDTEPEYERILRFFNRFQPGLVKRVKLYTKETPLFEQFGLAEEMNKALKSKVWLKSGGYIVINQTEALVAIDINTGKYVGKTSRLEDTIVKTNVDAIKEIVRQVRLRDLGGIIIIDFIDMDERRNRQRVMQALEEELRHDRAPSKVLQFNDFGLVAITRKRVKQSLERTIGAPCPYCQSTGYVKSLTTVANEIYVEMRKMAKHLEQEDVMLRVHPDVAKELKGNNGRLLNEMEELTKRTIIVKSDPALHQEQFDIN
jgi:ribonuclease G